MERANALAGTALIASLLLLSACGQSNTYVAPPPAKVTVATPTKKTITRYLDATGNTAPVNSADLVARVAGFVQEIKYQDGDKVAKGTLLFVIEPEPYRVKLEQAKAAQAGAEATLKSAEATFKRQEELLARGNTTQANSDAELASRDYTTSDMNQTQDNEMLVQIT